MNWWLVQSEPHPRPRSALSPPHPKKRISRFRKWMSEYQWLGIEPTFILTIVLSAWNFSLVPRALKKNYDDKWSLTLCELFTQQVTSNSPHSPREGQMRSRYGPQLSPQINQLLTASEQKGIMFRIVICCTSSVFIPDCALVVGCEIVIFHS